MKIFSAHPDAGTLPYNPPVPFKLNIAWHEREESPGLDYMMARYYGPKNLFRFLSPDPSGLEERLNRPGSFNPYVYVRNNPLRFTDADGLFATDPPVHQQVTRVGLSGFGLSGEAMGRIVAANIRQDALFGGRLNRKAHGTGFGRADKIIENSTDYIAKQLGKAQNAAADGNLKKALKHIGKGLHTIQDLVAHKDFPNLIRNILQLRKHGDNDANPLPLDELSAVLGSESWFQQFWDSLTSEQQTQLQTMINDSDNGAVGSRGGINVSDSISVGSSQPNKSGNSATFVDGVRVD